MTIQLGVTLRNALLATYESTIGTSPKRRYYTGTKPTVCSASATGTLLVEMTLPSDWMDAPSSGGAAKLGTWSGTALADGTAGYYRIYDSAGIESHGMLLAASDNASKPYLIAPPSDAMPGFLVK